MELESWDPCRENLGRSMGIGVLETIVVVAGYLRDDGKCLHEELTCSVEECVGGFVWRGRLKEGKRGGGEKGGGKRERRRRGLEREGFVYQDDGTKCLCIWFGVAFLARWQEDSRGVV